MDMFGKFIDSVENINCKPVDYLLNEAPRKIILTRHPKMFFYKKKKERKKEKNTQQHKLFNSVIREISYSVLLASLLPPMAHLWPC